MTSGRLWKNVMPHHLMGCSKELDLVFEAPGEKMAPCIRVAAVNVVRSGQILDLFSR